MARGGALLSLKDMHPIAEVHVAGHILIPEAYLYALAGEPAAPERYGLHQHATRAEYRTAHIVHLLGRLHGAHPLHPRHRRQLFHLRQRHLHPHGGKTLRAAQHTAALQRPHALRRVGRIHVGEPAQAHLHAPIAPVGPLRHASLRQQARHLPFRPHRHHRGGVAAREILWPLAG